MSETTFVIAIGNSDNKLTQAQWSLFYDHVDQIISHYGNLAGVQVHGRWVSPSTAPYQNAGWSLGWLGDLIHLSRDMQTEIRYALHEFGQDSMAWTVGETRLVPSLAPERPRWAECAKCGQRIGWINAPTGGWWAHEVHPADNHDAEEALCPAPVSLPGDARIEPPEPMQGDPRVTGKWSCGCDSRQCKVLWTIGRDASADPSQVIRATCVTHALHADSESARTSANQGMRQQAQALMKLDLAHAEQCR